MAGADERWGARESSGRKKPKELKRTRGSDHKTKSEEKKNHRTSGKDKGKRGATTVGDDRHQAPAALPTSSRDPGGGQATQGQQSHYLQPPPRAVSPTSSPSPSPSPSPATPASSAPASHSGAGGIVTPLHPTFWSGRLLVNGQVEHSFFDIKVRKSSEVNCMLATTDLPPIPISHTDRLRVLVFLESSYTMTPTRQQISQFDFCRATAGQPVKSTVAEQKELQKILQQPPYSAFISVRSVDVEWTFLDLGTADDDANLLYASTELQASSSGSLSSLFYAPPASSSSSQPSTSPPTAASSTPQPLSPRTRSGSSTPVEQGSPSSLPSSTKSPKKSGFGFLKLAGKKKSKSSMATKKQVVPPEEQTRPYMLVSLSWLVPTASIRDHPPC